MSKNTQVTIDKATMEFFVAECLQMHALCDRSVVPRVIDGCVLSMAQRVAILEGCYHGLVKRLGREPLFTEQ